MHTECRCSRYLSILPQYLFFQYIYTYVHQQCSTYVLQYQYVVRTAVGIVRARAGTAVGTVGTYINRFISRCSTCVNTAAVGTVVGSVDTGVTSL